MFFQKGLGNQRPLIEVFHMAFGHQFVKVLEAHLVFDQENDVVDGHALFSFELVDQVTFHAQDQFDAVLFGRGPGFRIGLHHPVVGDGDGRMAPLGGLLNEAVNLGKAVHTAHLGVAMELHALFGGVVLADSGGGIFMMSLA